MEHKQTIMFAPALSNSSCWQRDTSENSWTGPGPGQLLRASLILVLSLGILGANLLVICVINSRRYSKYIHAQVSGPQEFFIEIVLVYVFLPHYKLILLDSKKFRVDCIGNNKNFIFKLSKIIIKLYLQFKNRTNKSDCNKIITVQVRVRKFE